jgi:hypothetical protein
MRQVFRLIGNRYGAALMLVFVIAVVIAFGRLLGGPAHPPPGGYLPGPGATVDTTSSPIPDDGLDEPSASPAPPSMSPGAAPARTVALNFAKAWLHHVGVSAADWHTGLSRYSTKSLMDRLNGADPAGVPASQTTGDSTVVDEQPNYTDIAIPLDTGTLALRVVPVNGHWLVDGVDWQRP